MGWEGRGREGRERGGEGAGGVGVGRDVKGKGMGGGVVKWQEGGGLFAHLSCHTPMAGWCKLATQLCNSGHRAPD